MMTPLAPTLTLVRRMKGVASYRSLHSRMALTALTLGLVWSTEVEGKKEK